MKNNRFQTIVFAIDYLDIFFKGKEDICISALEWTKFHIKMYSIIHTCGELKLYACSFFSETGIRPSSIKEKLIYYISKKKLFTFLNFVFDVKHIFSCLRKCVWFFCKNRLCSSLLFEVNIIVTINNRSIKNKITFAGLLVLNKWPRSSIE